MDVKDIRAVSKIAGARAWMYSSSKDLGNQLRNKVVEVKVHSPRIKPLINNNRSVVISTIYPNIPHVSITEAMREIGSSIMSNVSYIRDGLTQSRRAHISSFRRQFYVTEEDERRVPESIQVCFGNSHNRCYPSTESMINFICKQNGHIPKSCPSVNVNNDETNVSQPNILDTENINTQQVPDQLNMRRSLSISEGETSEEPHTEEAISELPWIVEVGMQVHDAESAASEITASTEPNKKERKIESRTPKQATPVRGVLLPAGSMIEDKVIRGIPTFPHFVELIQGQNLVLLDGIKSNEINRDIIVKLINDVYSIV
ncbi:hypothetical protein QAD02_007950 [Eretmocerus hayati]|uniref:Uncharacterized protein n=1 Tax=Eretmocerus hayati TaxID=131215 RepID=A0ACC2N6E4_9HYME|nr:hypothetical protein QAD02_007950 [Eretmocerus hayati]